MNWKCAIGLHDWDTRRADSEMKVLDKNHKVHAIVVHNHGVGMTRICRRCDKRQILTEGGMTEPAFWLTVFPFEGIQERFPGNVGFRSSASIQQKIDAGEYVEDGSLESE